MNKEIMVLCATAASIGFIHTILGPDHYLPFIVMSRARKWSLAKTSLITVICGIGHVLSSVVIGLVGIFFGVAIMKLEALEAFRGNLAAWAFIGFGLMYFVWGIHRALRSRSHAHVHAHPHEAEDIKQGKRNITPWVLFTIFVLGPCEPLIPILMYPAAKSSLFGIFLVTTVFGTVTVMTMLSVVLVSAWGISFAPLGRLEKYSHALAGATICLSGLAIQLLGL
ncbi:MAG: hypothetical protein GF409_05630 [Candidatus Omnitrophica bacterium]|nr:hypothetical protein [Candidatus Omnitrophota bacterium]